ncbi:lectin subunit alpha-like [Cochliomyia hominivorax]
MTTKFLVIIFILELFLTSVKSNKMYYFENKKFLDWHKAYQACEDFGMSLVTINSKEELEYLKEYIQMSYGRIYPYWLGAFKINGQFEWIASGEKIKDFFWHEGQPDNKSGNENCIHTWKNDFDWNDNDCERELPFICELNI